MCDGKPFWADLVVRRRAIDAWLGATQKDVLKNFEWKVRETKRVHAKAVGIYELCGRPRRDMLLLVRLWKRESCRKRIEGSCSIVGKIAASGLLKDSVPTGMSDQYVLRSLRLPPSMRICSQDFSCNPQHFLLHALFSHALLRRDR